MISAKSAYALRVGAAVLALPGSGWAQAHSQTPATPIAITEKVEVIATRLPESPDEVPAAIEVLQRNKKATVYRLTALAPDGSDVIAKRARRITLAVERVIYERILPHVPVPSLCCYGYVDDPDRSPSSGGCASSMLSCWSSTIFPGVARSTRR